MHEFGVLKSQKKGFGARKVIRIFNSLSFLGHENMKLNMPYTIDIRSLSPCTRLRSVDQRSNSFLSHPSIHSVIPHSDAHLPSLHWTIRPRRSLLSTFSDRWLVCNQHYPFALGTITKVARFYLWVLLSPHYARWCFVGFTTVTLSNFCFTLLMFPLIHEVEYANLC